MKLLLKSLILLIFLFTGKINAQVLPSFGNSRTGTAGLQFLKIIPDARSSALSGSYTALIDDLSALYWNPAGLTHIDSQKYHIQASHTTYFADIGLNFLGLAYSKSKLNYWGLSIIDLSSGNMPITTEFQPFGTGQEFSVNNLLIGLSFAKVLSDNFSFGVSSKYVLENIADIKVHNGIFDFGFIYVVGVKKKTKFAVGISNFGFNVTPNGKVNLTTLNGDDEIDDFEKISVPSVFRLGIATRLLDKDIHIIDICGQLNHPTDNNETFALGLEYSLKKLLFVRTGYEFGTDQDRLPSLGFGINLQQYFGYLKFDYSFNNINLLGNIHRITLGIGLK